MDPSPGNIAPSWPVAIAHGMRNTTNPMIHQPNADGPADWTTAAFVMNKTIATKIATMSNVVSTLGRMPPATRSEISEPESVSAAVMAPPQRRRVTLEVYPFGVSRAHRRAATLRSFCPGSEATAGGCRCRGAWSRARQGVTGRRIRYNQHSRLPSDQARSRPCQSAGIVLEQAGPGARYAGGHQDQPGGGEDK